MKPRCDHNTDLLPALTTTELADVSGGHSNGTYAHVWSHNITDPIEKSKRFWVERVQDIKNYFGQYNDAGKSLPERIKQSTSNAVSQKGVKK